MKTILFTAAAFLFLSANGFCQTFQPVPQFAQTKIFSKKDVAIGTTFPRTKLHITNRDAGPYSTSPPLISNPSFECGTTLRLEFVQPVVNGCSGFSLWDISAINVDRSLRFSTIGAEGNILDAMTLTDAGRVGIGTTTPAQKLQVAGNIQLTDHLIFNSTYPVGVIDWPEIGDLYFRSNSIPGDVFSFTDRMLIDGETGNVGIGTTFPGERLQVSRGNIMVKGTNNFQSDGDEAILYLGDNNHSIKSIFGSGLRISTFQAQNAITILEGSGNVGIGTTTPNHRLDVCGTIRSKEWVVETFGCDFVFDKNYPLMALKERKKIVLQNKHLFYVQPASEMQEKGAEMGATIIGLLRNGEEHELYLYQLDEKDDMLKKKIELLEKKIELLEKKLSE